MKALGWIACTWLVAVFLRHSSAHWLAAASGYSPQAVNYMLGGALEVVAAAIITALLWAYTSAWRNLALAGCWIAILEGTQTVGCRLAVTDITKVPRGVNLCEFATGLPVFPVMFTLYVAIIIWMLRK